MTVKELKKLLESINENRIVILSKDAEGNSYSPLGTNGLDDTQNYEADSTWSGEVGQEGQPALVLYPIN